MWRLRFSAWCLAAFAAFCLLTTATAATNNTWTGTWHTSWTGGSNGVAEMALTQTGTTVTGTYNHLAGKLQGTVVANTLSGTWTQNNDHGAFAFTLNPAGNGWSGTWTGGKGGTWQGTCTGGACLANAVATAAPSPTSGGRPSATVVICNRDTNDTTNARYQCSAEIADAGVAPQPAHPTGTVTWTAPFGSFSSTTCTLTLPDVGVPSCTVEYDASNQDIPNQVATPDLTAAYGGDSVYLPSKGSPKLASAPSTPTNSGGVPLVAWLLGGGGLIGLAGLAWLAYANAHGGAAAIAALTEPGAGTPGMPGKAGKSGKGGANMPLPAGLPGKAGKSGKGGAGMPTGMPGKAGSGDGLPGKTGSPGKYGTPGNAFPPGKAGSGDGLPGKAGPPGKYGTPGNAFPPGKAGSAKSGPGKAGSGKSPIDPSSGSGMGPGKPGKNKGGSGMGPADSNSLAQLFQQLGGGGPPGL